MLDRPQHRPHVSKSPMMASAHTHAMISGVRAPAMIWPAIFEGAFSLAKVLFSLMNERNEP